jgi:hypothetical protein
MEIGEFLVFSWLKHIKECQLVQLNWKASQKWKLNNEDKIKNIQKFCEEFFSAKGHPISLFGNKKYSQTLKQYECDAIGISLSPTDPSKYYAIEVAFHADGLLYGKDSSSTVVKVLQKFVSIALCLLGYFNIEKAEVIFSSPKVGLNTLNEINIHVKDLNDLFFQNGYGFNFTLIANDDFNDKILSPVLKLGKKITDSNELFARAGILINMFGKKI